jgi:hypothetical protein
LLRRIFLGLVLLERGLLLLGVTNNICFSVLNGEKYDLWGLEFSLRSLIRTLKKSNILCPFFKPQFRDLRWGPYNPLSNFRLNFFGPRVNLLGWEADCSSQSSAEVKNGGAMPPLS